MSVELPACFKAYDIRGRVPNELHPELARNIGLAYGHVFQPKKVAVGHDIRLSSPELTDALIGGLLDAGVDVLRLGLCGTEEMYHAAFSKEDEGVDGGIIVTASHNPADYNGMKFVTKGARPVTGEGGLHEMATLISEEREWVLSEEPGREFDGTDKSTYIDHLLSYVDVGQLEPLKLVVNNGNGCAAPVIDLLESHLPFEFIKVHHRPDGTFPHGVPNPLLSEKRSETAELVKQHRADMGIAWDGDFDRCFFWDEKGNFIEGYYLVGLLGLELLETHPGAKVLHDPRLVWNTQELITEAGGVPILAKTGHAFIKERMREEDAIYGGEMSAHHYFKSFGYCDSGMIPWLLVASLLSRKGVSLSTLVAERMAAYPVSGEINSVVDDPDQVIAKVEAHFSDGEMDYTDGLSVSFPAFRFNIRKSNTEPLLRLNVESRGDVALMEGRTAELLQIINS